MLQAVRKFWPFAPVDVWQMCWCSNVAVNFVGFSLVCASSCAHLLQTPLLFLYRNGCQSFKISCKYCKKVKFMHINLSVVFFHKIRMSLLDVCLFSFRIETNYRLLRFFPRFGRSCECCWSTWRVGASGVECVTIIWLISIFHNNNCFKIALQNMTNYECFFFTQKLFDFFLYIQIIIQSTP